MNAQLEMGHIPKWKRSTIDPKDKHTRLQPEAERAPAWMEQGEAPSSLLQPSRLSVAP